MEEAQRSAQMRNERGWLRFTIFWKRKRVFLVMEFVEGETLRQRLTRPIQLQEFLYIAVSVPRLS